MLWYTGAVMAEEELQYEKYQSQNGNIITGEVKISDTWIEEITPVSNSRVLTTEKRKELTISEMSTKLQLLLNK